MRDQLIFACTSDISGKTRGKAFPASDLDWRSRRGVGWVPTNAQITCFDSIAESPYGPRGDLLLVPDKAAHVAIDFEDGTPIERFALGDILELDGTPWGCCTRSVLKGALRRLHGLAGVSILATFEQEFQFLGNACATGTGFALREFARHRGFAETLLGAMRRAGINPDSVIKEYGFNQWEVTCGPKSGIRACDEAVMVRELAHMTAARHGERITFSPILDLSGVGNGVHVHFSLVDTAGKPVTYDPDGVGGMSKLTGSFAAGVLAYIDSFLAITAPSGISFERLTPHRWSAAFNNLGQQDREAALRICPVTAMDPEEISRQFNLEYRAADSASSPHLALAAIVHAGCQGIEDGLSAPAITDEDLSLLAPEALASRDLARLPETLPEALDRFESSQTVRSWFPELDKIYLLHKRFEWDVVRCMDIDQRMQAYSETY